MRLTSQQILKRLGAGETIAAVAEAAGLSRAEFDAWWQEECRRRVPRTEGATRVAGIKRSARIVRDSWGVPHITADNDHDLYFGFGYAIAQDRLFQLDFLRRKASGRLAEILGQEGVESDLLYRTLGLFQIAEREWQQTPAEARDLLLAYTAGINAWMQQSQNVPAIEFDLLDYRPEPWTPVDSLAVVGEFRWYLTGRFPVIVIPELAKRTLGEGALYKAFLQGEADEEAILPVGSYPARGSATGATGGPSGDRDAGPGSNNWVLAATRTTTSKPIVSSDPHVPHNAVSIWYEVHLHGGSFHVAGVSYAGMPAVMIGRNERVAWGITNNICSLRDLYQEKTSPEHPDCFLYDGRWEPARERKEIIHIRDGASVEHTVRSSRNGPIVDELLPKAARHTGPVSLRWLGTEPCGWWTALLGMNRARSAEDIRQATRPWSVPTFNIVFADVDGNIGHQTTGRIPNRSIAERGYRPGWDPRHQWQGLIPFEQMPHQINPPRGFVVTANNRLAADDYPYPLSGTWTSGHRAKRIREVIERHSRMSTEDCQKLQLDVHSGRAREVVPALLALLNGWQDDRARKALAYLENWDYRVTVESVPAAIFNVFFVHWTRRVVAERFPADAVEFVSGGAAGLAAALLRADESGWFQKSDRRQAVQQAFLAALEELIAKLGATMSAWTWGRLHTLVQKHFLSGRGELGQLLDRSGLPVPGDNTTVCNNSYTGSDYRAWLGATYRMVADLGDSRCGLWAVEVASVSGHPGSVHYDDQLTPWSQGELRYLALKGEMAPETSSGGLLLQSGAAPR